MSKLLEMTAGIVAAQASTSPMSKAELLATINDVYAALTSMEKGEAPAVQGPGITEESTAPAISLRKSLGKNVITCMLCGKQMKTLARHLNTAHGMKPGEYRKQFNIPRTQPLAAKAYSEVRRQMAIDRDLGAGLVKARAARGKAKETAAREVQKKTSPKKRTSKKVESAPEVNE